MRVRIQAGGLNITLHDQSDAWIDAYCCLGQVWFLVLRTSDGASRWKRGGGVGGGLDSDVPTFSPSDMHFLCGSGPSIHAGKMAAEHRAVGSDIRFVMHHAAFDGMPKDHVS